MSDIEFQKRKAAAAAAALEAEAPPPAPAVEAPEPDAMSPKSKSGTALRAFGQGASFGTSDEVGGLAGGVVGLGGSLVAKAARTDLGRAALRKAFPEAQSLPDEAFDRMITDALQQGGEAVLGDKKSINPDHPLAGAKSGYLSERETARDENASAKSAHPYIYNGTEFVGSMAVPVPGMSGAVKGLKLTKLGQRAAQGVVLGGANAAGHSSAELVDDTDTNDSGGKDFVKEVALGAGAGGVIGPALGAAGDKFSGWLKRKAEENALKAIGVRAGISDSLGKRGYETAEEARSLGRAALDTDVIPVVGKASDVARNAAARQEVSGALIDDALTQSANARVKGDGFVMPDRPIKPDFDAMGMRAALNASEGNMLPTAVREGGRARRMVEDIAKLGEDPTANVLDANKMKSQMYDGIKWGTDTKLATKLQRQAVRGVKEGVEQHVEETAGPEVADQLRAANARYGQLADIKDLAREEATRQLGRQGATLAGSVTPALLGASAGGPAAGAGAAIGSYALKNVGPYLPALTARTQNAASPVVGAVTPGLSRVGGQSVGAVGASDSNARREQWQAVLNDIGTTGGAGLGKYAQVFKSLPQEQWAAMNEALMMKDPEYAATTQQLTAR